MQEKSRFEKEILHLKDARNENLALAKRRKCGKALIHAVIKKQLRYIRRNLKYID